MRRLALLVVALLALTATPALAQTAADQFDIMLINTETRTAMWVAGYDRTLSPGVGWDDGDRAGYRCAYMFLMRNGQPVGRATFIRIDGAAAYTMVNDERMVEGHRYFDGTLAGPDAPMELKECPFTEQPYEPYFGPDQRPVITYNQKRGAVLETRNYLNTVAGPGVTFRQVASTQQGVTVIGYQDGQPAVAVYYESLVPAVVMRSTVR